MPTIQEIRARYPQTGGMSDADIITRISQAKGIPAAEVATDFGLDLPTSNTGKNLASGWANYKAGLERFGGELTGSDTLNRWADENTARAELLNATSTSVKDTEDIHGLGDAASWLGYNAAQAVPYVGEFLVPGGLAVKASRGLRTGIKAAELAGDINKANQLKNALSARAVGAGTVASYPSSTGDIMQNMMEQSGYVDNSAYLFGAPYAALNAVSPGAGIAHALIRGLPTMAKGRIANALATGTAASLVGGAQETGQEVFNQYGRNVVDPNYDPFGDQAQRAYRESFLAGAALSGIPGAIGGGLHKPGLTQEEYDARRLQEEQDRLAEEQARAAAEQQAQEEARQQQVLAQQQQARRTQLTTKYPFSAVSAQVKAVEKAHNEQVEAAKKQFTDEYYALAEQDRAAVKLAEFLKKRMEEEGVPEKMSTAQAYDAFLSRQAEADAKVEEGKRRAGMGLPDRIENQMADIPPTGFIPAKPAKPAPPLALPNYANPPIQVTPGGVALRNSDERNLFYGGNQDLADAGIPEQRDLFTGQLGPATRYSPQEEEAAVPAVSEGQKALFDKEGAVVEEATPEALRTRYINARVEQLADSGDKKMARNRDGRIPKVAFDSLRAVVAAEQTDAISSRHALDLAEMIKNRPSARAEHERNLHDAVMDHGKVPTYTLRGGEQLNRYELLDRWKNADPVWRKVVSDLIGYDIDTKEPLAQELTPAEAAAHNGVSKSQVDKIRQKLGISEDALIYALARDWKPVSGAQLALSDQSEGGSALHDAGIQTVDTTATDNNAGLEHADRADKRIAAIRAKRAPTAMETAMAEAEAKRREKADAANAEIEARRAKEAQKNKLSKKVIDAAIANDEVRAQAGALWTKFKDEAFKNWPQLTKKMKDEWVNRLVGEALDEQVADFYDLPDATLERNMADMQQIFEEVQNESAGRVDGLSEAGSTGKRPDVERRSEEAAFRDAEVVSRRNAERAGRGEPKLLEPARQPGDDVAPETKNAFGETVRATEPTVTSYKKPVETGVDKPVGEEREVRLTGAARTVAKELVRLEERRRTLRSTVIESGKGSMSVENRAKKAELKQLEKDIARTKDELEVVQAEEKAKKRGGDEIGAADLTTARLSPLGVSTGQRGMPLVDATGVVAGVRPLAQKVWRVDIRLVDTFASLPQEVQDAVRENYDGDDTKGVLHKGVVYLVADAHVDAADLETTILHEVKGHVALRRFYGPQIYAQLAKLFDSVGGWNGIKTLAKRRGLGDVIARYTEDIAASTKLSDETKRGLLMEELLAHLAQEPRFTDKVKAIVGAIRALLRRFSFFKLAEYGETDLLNLLRQANARIADTTNDSGPVVLRVAAADLAGRIAGKQGRMAVTDFGHAAKKALGNMMFLHDLIDEVKGTMPSIETWYTALQNSVMERNRLEKKAEDIAAMADKLKTDEYTALNDFISRSTFEQKWGYDPQFPDRKVVVDPDMARAFAKLNPELQAIVKAVFAHGEETHAAKKALFKSLGASGLLEGDGKLQGPYAPLKRFGNYVAVLKSQKVLDAEEAYEKDKTAANERRVNELKSNPAEYVQSHFDTKGQARIFAEANASKFALADYFEGSTRVGTQREIDYKTYQRILEATKLDKNMPEQARKAFEDMVRDMLVRSLDDNNARLSGLKRMNRAGYDADMIKSFLHHARADAAFMSNIKYGGAINEAFMKLQQEAKDKDTKLRNGQDVFNLIANHYASNLAYKETPWQDRLTAGVTVWQLSLSLGYHLQNATQPVMVTVPKLASDFSDYSGAWTRLMAGYRMARKLVSIRGGVDLTKLDKTKHAGLLDALLKAENLGVLAIGMEENLNAFDKSRTGYTAFDNTSGAIGGVLHHLRKVAQFVEGVNRVASAVAAYELAKSHGKAEAYAQDYAVKIIQSTQGDFTRAGAPLIIKNLPKPTVQYRKYQFMMAALYAKAFRDATMGSTPEQKAVGRRMLGYKLMHTSLAAGVLGWPMANLAAMFFAFSGDDDEPKDLERWLREMIGDDTTANLLLHGPLAALGLDASAKLGDDKIFSIADFDLTSAAGLGQTAFSLIGGPSAAVAGRMADGVGMLKDGEPYKAIEKFMPKGVADAMQAFRLANEGYTTRNGDVLVNPEELVSPGLLFDALGMPTSEIKLIKWTRGQQYEIEQFYKDRTAQIEHAYRKAAKAGDSETMQEMRQEWMSLQDGKDRVREFFHDNPSALKRQPLSVLLKYPDGAEKREKRAQANFAD